MPPCQPCTFEFSRGGGTGVAEALGNWGFSNEVASPGHELSRMQCLLERMEKLREMPKCPGSSSKKKERPTQLCIFEHSPPNSRSESKSDIKPLIMYTSIAETLFTSDKRLIRDDRARPIKGRRYAMQGNDKWYKLGPLCCPQPCCPAPYCSNVKEVYCCTGHC